MRAAVFEGEGRLAILERPEPVPGPGEALVEVEACGICGSDVHVLAVPPGHPATPGVILGHEFVGRIVGLGEGAGPTRIGQRVVVDPDPKCGVCVACRSGRPADCNAIVALGVYRDGALARLVNVPVASLHPISDAVPPAIAALAEPLACVVNSVERAAPSAGASAVVFGAGTIGCLFAAILRLSGCGPVIVAEPSEPRRAVAKAVGADLALTPTELVERREELLPEGADIVVDAVGSVLGPAIETVATGGRIVLFGMDDQACTPVRQVEITRRSLTIVGTYITRFTFPKAVRLLERGALNLEPLITAVLPLDRTAEGIDRIRSGEATKIVIMP